MSKVPCPWVLSKCLTQSPRQQADSVVSFTIELKDTYRGRIAVPRVVNRRGRMPLTLLGAPSIPVASRPGPATVASNFAQPSTMFPVRRGKTDSPFLLVTPAMDALSTSPKKIIFFRNPRPTFPTLRAAVVPLSTTFTT